MMAKKTEGSDKEISVLNDSNAFLNDSVTGLSKELKQLPSKYFYDDLGSKIFEKITKLSEYYVTRVEDEILGNQKKKIVKCFPEQFNLIEFGVGDGHKTKILISEMLSQKKKLNYIPIDISSEPFDKIISSYTSSFFEPVRIHGIVADYIKGLKLFLSSSHKIKIYQRSLILFLGSSIGNFSKKAEEEFLIQVRKIVRENDLFLIGFDLKKDPAVLISAYSDKKGVTAQFNINLLKRMNQELGANFNLKNFVHYGRYNPQEGAMESYLLSKKRQIVTMKKANKTFHFNDWEPIHTEFSYKYDVLQINELAKKTGFAVEEVFFDRKKYFANVLLRAK